MHKFKYTALLIAAFWLLVIALSPDGVMPLEPAPQQPPEENAPGGLLTEKDKTNTANAPDMAVSQAGQTNI